MSSCAAARMGIERDSMALHSRELGSHFYAASGRFCRLWRRSQFGAMTLEEMTAQVAKTPTSYLAWLELRPRVARVRWFHSTPNAFRRW
ncbi:hypothetical protein KCP76_07770 [Salmonella enterica subsp. enterica serovar Weltevreden]|nr:hypothetical protein KCP76_07770 [Salmonella enterica subsp. enterica serovar Weltevreden]